MRSANRSIDRLVAASWKVCLLAVFACSLSPRSESAVPAVRPSHQTCVAPQRPSAPVRLSRAFPQARFDEPVSIAPSPDHRWWFVAERRGRVWRLAANDPATPAELVLDLSNRVNASTPAIGLLAIAVHPRFDRTGALFVSYTGHGKTLARSQVARYVSRDGGLTFEHERSLLALDQISDYHVNTDLRFGPDGFLYVGFGDGGPQGDPRGNAQNPRSLMGKILRLDVDTGHPYAIPKDNPFARGGGAPEVWALGLRNPWRFSFDRETGTLWAGDVGEDHFEEIDRITRGGNYGWNLREGSRCTKPAACKAVDTLAPLLALAHPLVASVTFGFAYRGSALPDLRGHLIYADYASGVIWALDPDTSPPQPRMLHDGGHSIVAFAEDADGELLVVDLAGTLWRIEPGLEGPADAPTMLSETGCFERGGTPAAGLIPYEVNVSFWSDGGAKRRWFAIPDRTTIEIDRNAHLELPVGSVVVKEFSIAGMRVETRLLVRHDDGEWAGYTYRWDATQSDARLVPENAAGATSAWPRPWYYPHRGECSRCHQAAAGHTLGLELAQLRRQVAGGDQLALFERIGLFAGPVPVGPAVLSTSPTIEQRARAWLHTNCAYCHRPGGTGQGNMDLRYSTPLENMNVCDVPVSFGSFAVADARRIAPGDPGRSMIARRMRSTSFLKMPPLGALTPDAEGIALVEQWIRGLTCDAGGSRH